ncbi:MAG: hypothetical protein QOE36_3268 [Gaiellaceae bacterium]|nr:hypothetical protein [Gaiellaceae bacterium]
MTKRGRLALWLGVATYLAAWAFGSKPLYPVAVGLLLVSVAGWAWVRLAAGPLDLRRNAGRGGEEEGDDVQVTVDVELAGRVPPASVVLVERIARLGELATPLERFGGRLRGEYVLERVPRGRYAFEESRIVIEDAFGLDRVELPLPTPGSLLVYPRLVELDRLFSESGAHAADGRRLLLQRPSGFDLHSVREYEQGESLRKVHWRTTARRGQLMVKELEDAPRDEVAVLLDGDAAAATGVPPDSSFDVQVRAAGSILRAYVRRGRRSVLIVNSALRETQRVHSDDGDWRAALELLAAAEATSTRPAASLLAEESSPAARALELVVITARLTAPLVDRLVQRSLSRRAVSLVYVDAASFVRSGAAIRPEPDLLRLQGVGVPVAVCRRGDDLAAALGAAAPREAALAFT